MREPQFFQQPDLGAVPLADGGRGPFPHAVAGDDRRLLERRGVKRRSRVGLMVFREENRNRSWQVCDLRADGLAQVELLGKPGRQDANESPPPVRGHGQVALEHPGELQNWLVVENHSGELRWADAAVAETIVDRVAGKPLVVLAPREAFLLRRGQDPPVADQTGRGVVVVG